ncbi:MAG TPA: LLM class flavin-dependent oxidoreductase, partial [Rhizomicrobium sp.]|nr:LLM class flavin-dependent oxidoreductase [Rhizomicrobium sp.]
AGLDHDARYDLTEEWTRIVKRLWTEPKVSVKGKHFDFRDCASEPKPLKPPFLICAGMSARGFEFSVREADGCFIGGRNEAEIGEASRRAKALAAKLDKPIRIYCMMTVITAATDAQAEAKAQKYREGLDEGAVLGMLESYGVPLSGDGGNAMTARAQGAFMTQTVVGSPATCAAKIEKFLRDCEIDGLMFIYDDYIQGLRVTGHEILPPLRKAFA